MPDRRVHRGPHPDDLKLFAPDVWPLLVEAIDDLCWLLNRGYPTESARTLVGDRCTAWFNLARETIERHVPDARLPNLGPEKA